MSVSLTWSMPTTLQMFASLVVILVQCTLVGNDEVLRDKDEAGTILRRVGSSSHPHGETQSAVPRSRHVGITLSAKYCVLRPLGRTQGAEP